jgi:hydrogenase maturation protease
MKKETVVLGLGNPLMTDEGIGVQIVQQLAELNDKYPTIEFLDAGMGGISVLHLIAERKKAVFIDCALMGVEPGWIVRFTDEDVESTKKLLHYSLHEVDLLSVIRMSKELGQCPQQIVIFGIEPEIIEPANRISDKLRENLDNYISVICKELDG